MKIITCKLTGAIGRGVRAHIIPKAFYELHTQNGESVKLISSKQDEHIKRLPKGIYDKTIVTSKGEKYFQLCDDYAIKTLIKHWNKFEKITLNQEIVYWCLSRYNYKLLKLFALSMLWRANVSNDPVFSKVHLGPHEKIIRDMILNSEPVEPEDYSVVIARWTNDHFLIMDPFPERYNGINFYRLYCGRFVFYIKVDKRKTINEFNKPQLSPDKKLYIIAHDFNKRKEFPIVRKIVLQNEKYLYY